ncbi:sensor histidine kinase [Sphingomonas floccifaciens]|uniref:Sensor histidine kinase n=1 Tax=Sphingomonas floccifaciens TaxID=1844115 RepID=A0ABW4NGP2_9SPHN
MLSTLPASPALSLRRLVPRPDDLPVLALYAFGFVLAHQLAFAWGGSGYYSLWFPVAGLRLALLWRMGARLTLAVALIELGIDLVTGAAVLTSESWGHAITGVVRPVIAYGVVVALVRRLSRDAQPGSALATAPMPFALASVLAPLAAALAAGPQAFWRPELTGVADAREIILSLSAFAVGDLLGVVLVAPPLLWAVDRLRGHPTAAPAPAPPLATIVEASLVFATGAGVSGALAWVGLGLQPAPIAVAIAWLGLRLGQSGALAAVLLVAAVLLPLTAGAMPTPERLQFHLGLATIVAVGYLAGSFADAAVRARADLSRRDRLLFQADRLKTLRAMSVAVIHEISQPLSTLAIEARHLRTLTAGTDDDIAETVALIDRKAGHLSTLVRRLRRYGGRAVDEPTPLPLSALIDTVTALARPETVAAGVTLRVDPVPADAVVLGQEVELAQAVVNLVRNAVQACARGGDVMLESRCDAGAAMLVVVNRCAPDVAPQPGMGVGTLVARAIVEAHGGTLARHVDTSGVVRAEITLPLMEEIA